MSRILTKFGYNVPIGTLIIFPYFWSNLTKIGQLVP